MTHWRLLLILLWLVIIPTSYSQPHHPVPPQTSKISKLSIANVVAHTPENCAVVSLTKAYQALGIELEFIVLPSKRSIIASNNGLLDGETARIAGIEKKYPNLIPIPVAICRMETVAVSKQTIKFKQIEDLTQYKMGIKNGALLHQKLFKGVEYKPFVYNKQLINAVRKKQIDLAIMTKSKAESLINQYGYSQLTIQQPVLATTYLYHYLNKKHQHLVQKLTSELKKLEASGFIEQAMRNHQD
ncbi:hypothetical protein C2869_01375 [Saccharobesus litoralis]|uniref:Uncharacterized protein n=1 Tax=Saccharobesus litoralis TaxID=2172099 RepID=A0A2S0VLU0_9ALTE|nr:transporter substrate-binding domain-containing protein [Saccharobesus litoralis]AWB65176.1 hypothetical protein C2869_01375 [Saccharobesus litoralis]